MILLIFGICILMVVCSSILYDKFDTDTYCNLAIFGIALGFVSFIAIIALGIEVKSFSVIDDRIAMYE